jgi:hypothetical protein
VANLRGRLGAIVFVAAAIAAYAASAASPAHALLGLPIGLGGSNCPNAGSQVFKPFDGDQNNYYLASNGGFESGSTGWSLSGGASVVSGNQTLLAGGSHSLALPSGSAAVSPQICLGPNDLYVRLFVNDRGGYDSGLRVRVVWYGLLNQVLGLTDIATYSPVAQWTPGGQVEASGGGNILIPLLGSTSARVQITPLGSGSNWRIDDLYVDPWRMG